MNDETPNNCNDELDESMIVRPERFITPEMSGVVIPTKRIVGDRPCGQWALYVCSADGTRELRELTPHIDLSDGRRLWIHPMPPEPTGNMHSGWSKESRDRYLAGARLPKPEKVFRDIRKAIYRYLFMPPELADGISAVLSLWIVLTYVFHAWTAVPYLFVGGPLNSGKTRVFEILSRLVFRPLSSANMTVAALFRTLNVYGGTLLLDEAERLRYSDRPEVQELVAALLAGYKRGCPATRLEPVGDTFRTVSFDVYGPKAIACITGIPPALASRAITITMSRAPANSEQSRRRIDDCPERWKSIRDSLHEISLEHGPVWLELANLDCNCPDIANRDYELWQPLISLADFFENHGVKNLGKLVRDFAKTNIETKHDDTIPEADATLLRELAKAVRNGKRLTSRELLERARGWDQVTFRNWTPERVSSCVRRYGVPAPTKSGNRREWRLTLQQLWTVQDAYGIDLGVQKDESD